MANDLWQTPPSLFRQLDEQYFFDLDAAANKANALHDVWFGPGSDFAEDALEVRWRDFGCCVWCNPPYSRGSLEAFVKKAYEESLDGVVVVMLVPHDTSTKWWHEYAMKAAQILLPDKRVRFVDPATGKQAGSPAFASAVLVFHEAARIPALGVLHV